MKHYSRLITYNLKTDKFMTYLLRKKFIVIDQLNQIINIS